MSKEMKLIPELRFPEFKKDGEWEMKPFSRFIKLYRGSSPRPIREYLTQSETGVNWIKIGDTSSITDFVIRSVSEKITPEGAEKSRAVNKGELILANSMSYGNTYQLSLDGCIYDGWFVLREYEEVFNKQFLLQLLNSNYMQEQYKKFAAGGIVQNISSEIVYSTLLPKTSIQEQQKIASCLSSLDELITAHSDKLKTLNDHKKGLMQNLFPQKGQKLPNYRFPEFEKDGKWEEKELGEICKFTGGGTPSKKKDSYWTGKYPWISSSDIDEGSIHHVTISRFITEQAIQESATKIVPANSILLVSRVGVGKLAFTTEPICTSQDFTNLTPTNDNLVFLAYYLKSHKEDLLAFNQGMAIKGFTKKDVESLKIFLPVNEKEQKKIAFCLSSLDELITAQSKKNEQLQQHKKGLMQGLFPNTNGIK